MSNTLTQEQKSRRRWRIAGIGGILAAGFLGAWHFFLRGNASEEKLLEFPTETTAPDTTIRPPVNTGGGSSGSSNYKYRATYPIELYTYGPKVEQLQIALKSSGANLKADGYWGPATQRAVERAGLPSKIISDSYLQKLRGKANVTPTTTPSGEAAARIIARATNAEDFDTVMAVLRRMQDTSDYRKVSIPLANVFNNDLETFDRFGNKANRNLVNTLLADRMKWSLSQKSAFAAELRRMGLVQRNGSWSLAGIVPGTEKYVAIHDTTATDEAGNPVPVKAGTYVGEVVRSDPISTIVIPSDGLFFAIPTKDIQVVW